jgi:hypothetical protein
LGNNIINGGGGYEANNSELMAILLDADRPPNDKHIRNPRKVRYFDPKQVSGNNMPGLSTDDFVFRDPWGMPYIVTLDMNDDNKCRDAHYRLFTVSGTQDPIKGQFGLMKADPNNNDSYELSGPIMIWSFGPDRDFRTTKDNVMNWQ